MEGFASFLHFRVPSQFGGYFTVPLPSSNTQNIEVETRTKKTTELYTEDSFLVWFLPDNVLKKSSPPLEQIFP